MKNLSLLLITASLFSFTWLNGRLEISSPLSPPPPPPPGIAQFCSATGECWEITRHTPDGHNWVNACCSDFEIGPHIECTDDCGSSSFIHPDPPIFIGTQHHFALSDGRSIWIVENDELSSGSFDEQSNEYGIINSIPDFSWLDDSDSIEYVTINIDSSSYAIVSQSNSSQLRKKNKSDQTASPALKELSKQIFKGYLKKNKITLYPNPVEAGEQVKIETLLEVESVTLYNSSGKEVSPKLRKTSENTYSFSPNGFSGVVYVKVFIKNGGVYKSKLVVRD